MRVTSCIILLLFVSTIDAFLNDWEFVPKKPKATQQPQQPLPPPAAVDQPAVAAPEGPAPQLVPQTMGSREAFRDSVQPFSRTNMTKVQARLGTLKRRVVEKLKITDEKQAEVQQRMKSYHPKVHKRVKSAGDGIHEVNSRANITHLMYQADIVLTEEQAEILVPDIEKKRSRRQAYRDRWYPSTLWSDNTVYYYFDKSATPIVREVFTRATEFWHNNTCVSFVQSSTAVNRIRVFRGEGCYSYIGMTRGEQELSLGDGCESVGTAAHELGHALGFFHEQSRYDRDQYITVNVKNIQPDFVDQFDKETTATNYNYGMPYDYGSIMQYGGLSASRGKSPTMVAKDIKYQDTMGSDIGGFYDVSMMNEHYMCKVKCPAASSAQCTNGGYPSPRDCQICQCPSGYGGPLCDQRPPGCGSILQATSQSQALVDYLGTPSKSPRINFTTCNYWIEAPVGQRIEVSLTGFDGYFTDGCIYGGVEVKTNADQKLTGYRLCSNQDVGVKFVSSSNRVPLITFNRYDTSKVQLSYKITSDAANGGSKPEVQTTTKKSIKCMDYGFNCSILQYFGYCRMKRARTMCPYSCGVC